MPVYPGARLSKVPLGVDQDRLLLVYLARSCRNGRVLAEFTDARSGQSWHLWTLAPLLGTLMRQGVLTIGAEERRSAAFVSP